MPIQAQDRKWAEGLKALGEASTPALHPYWPWSLRRPHAPAGSGEQGPQIFMVIEDPNPWLMPAHGGISVSLNEAKKGPLNAIVWAPEKKSLGGVAQWSKRVDDLVRGESSLCVVMCQEAEWETALPVLRCVVRLSVSSRILCWRVVKGSPRWTGTWVSLRISVVTALSSLKRESWNAWLNRIIEALNSSHLTEVGLAAERWEQCSTALPERSWWGLPVESFVTKSFLCDSAAWIEKATKRVAFSFSYFLGNLGVMPEACQEFISTQERECWGKRRDSQARKLLARINWAWSWFDYRKFPP